MASGGPVRAHRAAGVAGIPPGRPMAQASRVMSAWLRGGQHENDWSSPKTAPGGISCRTHNNSPVSGSTATRLRNRWKHTRAADRRHRDRAELVTGEEAKGGSPRAARSRPARAAASSRESSLPSVRSWLHELLVAGRRPGQPDPGRKSCSPAAAPADALARRRWSCWGYTIIVIRLSPVGQRRLPVVAARGRSRRKPSSAERF